MLRKKKLSQIKKTGFTLVELLVVIAIIGILSTLAVVSLNGARSKARDARRLSDLKAVQSALELYRDDNFDKVVAISTNWATTIGTDLNATAIYLPAGAPVDPDPTRTDDLTYTYCVATDLSFYLVHALLENNPPAPGLNGPCTLTICGDNGANCVNEDGFVTVEPTCNNTTEFCLGRL